MTIIIIIQSPPPPTHTRLTYEFSIVISTFVARTSKGDEVVSESVYGEQEPGGFGAEREGWAAMRKLSDISSRDRGAPRAPQTTNLWIFGYSTFVARLSKEKSRREREVDGVERENRNLGVLERGEGEREIDGAERGKGGRRGFSMIKVG